MPIKHRRAYLEAIRVRYQNAPKKQKTLILNEFCQTCRYSRKYAIRILNGKGKSSRHPVLTLVDENRGRGVGGFAFEEIGHEFWEKLSWVNVVEFTGFDKREENSHGFSAPFGVSAVPSFSSDDWISQ